MSNLNQHITLPSSVRYLLGGILVLGGCFFIFVAYVLFVADKSTWPHPVGGILLGIAILLIGALAIYFSFRMFKQQSTRSTLE